MPGNYRSGRPAVPTALHVLRGTLRSRHVRARAGEPKATRGAPPAPAALEADPQARAHWDRLAAQLTATGVLTHAHGDALCLLAEKLAARDRVRDQLHAMGNRLLIIEEVRDKKTGVVVRVKPRANPLLAIDERLALTIQRLLSDFGLTPMSQTKVQATHAHEAPSRVARYISG